MQKGLIRRKDKSVMQCFLFAIFSLSSFQLCKAYDKIEKHQ